MLPGKKSIIAFILLISTTKIYSQDKLKWDKIEIKKPFYEHVDFGFSIGSSHYSGEIGNSWNLIKETRGQFRLELVYNATKATSVGLNITSGWWYSNDLNHQNLYNRNWYGTSYYTYPSILTRRKFNIKKKRTVPYVESGIGLHIHKTKEYQILDDKVIMDPGVMYSFGISFGSGVEYRYNRYFDLFASAMITYHFSDKVDNLVYEKIEADKIGFLNFGVRLLLWERPKNKQTQ